MLSNTQYGLMYFKNTKDSQYSIFDSLVVSFQPFSFTEVFEFLCQVSRRISDCRAFHIFNFRSGPRTPEEWFNEQFTQIIRVVQ